jgi:hypothetical protein
VYVIGADPAEGLAHGDFSSAHVINARTHRIVAHWHGHVDADVFGEDVLNLLGRWYRNALLGVENNNHGHTTLVALRGAAYPNIYKQYREGQAQPHETDILGWRTTKQSKARAIDELGREFRNGMQVPDQETVQELKTFVRDGNGRMNGSPHDDRVMSLAIANQMLNHAFLPQYLPRDDYAPGTWGWLKQKRKSTPVNERPLIGESAVRSGM